jgi:hypothetical protein
MIAAAVLFGKVIQNFQSTRRQMSVGIHSGKTRQSGGFYIV